MRVAVDKAAASRSWSGEGARQSSRGAPLRAPGPSPDLLALRSILRGAPPPTAQLAHSFGEGARDVPIEVASTKAGHAEGMTIGGRVHLAPGRFDVQHTEGRVRLGHEVAHALQQRRGAGLPATLTRTERGALEGEAERAGQAFAKGEAFSVEGRAPAGAALYRDPADPNGPPAPRSPGEIAAEVQQWVDSVGAAYEGNSPSGTALHAALAELLPNEIGDDRLLTEVIVTRGGYVVDEGNGPWAASQIIQEQELGNGWALIAVDAVIILDPKDVAPIRAGIMSLRGRAVPIDFKFTRRDLPAPLRAGREEAVKDAFGVGTVVAASVKAQDRISMRGGDLEEDVNDRSAELSKVMSDDEAASRAEVPAVRAPASGAPGATEEPPELPSPPNVRSFGGSVATAGVDVAGALLTAWLQSKVSSKVIEKEIRAQMPDVSRKIEALAPSIQDLQKATLGPVYVNVTFEILMPSMLGRDGGLHASAPEVLDNPQVVVSSNNLTEDRAVSVDTYLGGMTEHHLSTFSIEVPRVLTPEQQAEMNARAHLSPGAYAAYDRADISSPGWDANWHWHSPRERLDFIYQYMLYAKDRPELSDVYAAAFNAHVRELADAKYNVNPFLGD